MDEPKPLSEFVIKIAREIYIKRVGAEASFPSVAKWALKAAIAFEEVIVKDYE